MQKTDKLKGIKKSLAKSGKSGNEIKRLSKDYEKIIEKGKNRMEPKTNKDSPLFADAKDWDEEDKRHDLGIYRLYFFPNKRFSERYDMIDWSDE